MLEEHTMEKKNLSRLQPPTKGTATEVKKNPDAQNSKLFPRSNRKREPPGNNASKYDQSRRPPSQKSKTCDKRPKPRGLYYSSRKEGTQINDEEDLESEFGQLFSPHDFDGGSKKQSLNHLLNFHSYSLQNCGGRALRGGGGAAFIGSGSTAMRQTYKQYTTKSLMSTHAHKYNKEQFLQANCQFVVRASGDYTLNLADPDLLVDWEQVELIRVWSGDGATTTCPICLYPPVAAKITRCGHVFCWTCALHYLALSDKTWRKCPICYEAVHIHDLKSVECVEKIQYSVGQEITLQLMKREKGSLIVTPAHQCGSRSTRGPILNMSETELDTVYSKLLLAQQSDIDKILDNEYLQLQEQVIEFTGCPELCFVEQALEALMIRRSRKEQNIEQVGASDVKLEDNAISESVNDTNHSESQESFDPMEEPIKRESSSEESESIFLIPGKQSENSSSSIEEITVADLYINTSSNTSCQPVKYFYFYQSTDGQQIYLHSINVHMLQSTFGNLEDCPSLIVGKIVEKETGSMTSELRHRLRYMQHVPITCQFDVVELDLKPPVISLNALTLFQDQIESRRRRRQRLERAEKKRERMIEEAERRKYGRSGEAPVNLRIESHFHFPECGSEVVAEESKIEIASSNSEQSNPVESANSSRSVSPSLMSKDPTLAAVAALTLEPSQEVPSGSGVSFAQMLREGKSMRSEDNGWPSVSNSGNDAKWSQHFQIPGQSRSRQRQPSLPTVTDSDDCSFSPPAKPSFSIADALRAAASASERGLEAGGRKKKKKQQKVLLFTTGMPCANGSN
ncbi:E3 ubiquitin-protein ligase RNF10 isoform X2 [Rhodnius prolixus]|uniref:E3 ubiquitin-protein ligase RNF10 n=1 Tax=Rhodnius prolixus TaxID=13249 RepID=A0A905QWK3_RHOPR